MPFLKVLTYPHPVLTGQASAVTIPDLSVEALTRDMMDTLYQEDGVGLAAPQVGVSKRVIVISPNAQKGEERILINPQIVERSKEEEAGIEGCLSLPDFSIEVMRAKRIKVQAVDLSWRPFVETFEDFPGRVVQHEIDHLNGILLTDYAQFLASPKQPKAKVYRM